MKKDILLKTSVFALLCSGAVSTTAHAQSAVEALSADVITVTATKKAEAENIQDVALAITAYGEDQLDALKVRDLESLTVSMPNVALDDIGTVPGTANFSIRGLGVNSSIVSVDPTVGVFVDGMYMGTNAGVVLDLFDLESVEVLRGPQGILFGRNVTGGAVLINTKDPGDEFEVDAKLAVESGFRGTGANYYIMGSVNAPLSETLSARMSFYLNDDRGYHERYLGGPVPHAIATSLYTAAGAAVVAPGGPADDAFVNHGKAETILLRPSVKWTPTDSFDLLLKYEHGKSVGDGPASQNHTSTQGSTNAFFSADRDDFDFSIDAPGYYDNSWNQLILEASLDVALGDGTITNILAWRELEMTTLSDIDSTPLALFHAYSQIAQEQYSNELRYNGRFNDKFDVTAGVYYFTQDVAATEQRLIPPQALVASSPYFSGGGVQDHSTVGVFGQVDVDLTQALTLNLGVRWTNEEKDVVISNLLRTRTFPYCTVEVTGSCSEDFTDSDSWNNVTPKIGIQYVASDDVNFYAHWTKGVRSGGYNFRNTSFAFAPGPFDEEVVNSYEMGLKALSLDRRATLNAALFLTDIQDMQREINLSDPIAGVVQTIRNTADASIFGVEIEGKFAVGDSLLLSGSVGYVDGDYETVKFDLNGDGALNSTDETLDIPRLAPVTYSLGAVHSYELENAMIVNSRINLSHRDDSAYTDSNIGVLNEVDILDASVTLDTGNGATISLYGKNLLHEVAHGGDTLLPSSLGGGTFSPLTKGRIIGLEFQHSF